MVPCWELTPQQTDLVAECADSAEEKLCPPCYNDCDWEAEEDMQYCPCDEGSPVECDPCCKPEPPIECSPGECVDYPGCKTTTTTTICEEDGVSPLEDGFCPPTHSVRCEKGTLKERRGLPCVTDRK